VHHYAITSVWHALIPMEPNQDIPYTLKPQPFLLELLAQHIHPSNMAYTKHNLSLKANTKPIQHIPTQYPTYKQPNHITSNNIPQVNRLGQDYKLLGPIKPIQLNTPHKTKPFLPSNTPQTTMITHLLNPLVKG
jgi:hypothetical protein